MKILFVHQNFPGQFKHLAPVLADESNNEVVALSIRQSSKIPKIVNIKYSLTQGNGAGVHFLAQDFESKVIRAEGAGKAALSLKNRGFIPDVIYAHPGWGETLLLRDVFPNAKMIFFMEFYYHTYGADVNFDPEYPTTDLMALGKVRMKNAANLLSLSIADLGVSPTHWQKQQYPKEFQYKINVIHDGIDTDIVRPNKNAWININPLGLKLTQDDELITFINRNMEPMRGYHIFMRALPKILKLRPNARILIIGGDGVSYGSRPEKGSYKERYLAEVRDRLDLSRIHFLGSVPYPVFLSIIQISSVHVYLTVPFVLSWSMLEAMSAGCIVVGSKTPPVEEVIVDKENGFLVDFFDFNLLAETVVEILENKRKFDKIRLNARQTVVEKYDLKRVCLPKQIDLFKKFTY